VTDPVWIIAAGDEPGCPRRWWTGIEWSVDPEKAREYDRSEIQDEGYRLKQKLQWPWIKAMKKEEV
jgi:hypothetical protein